MNMNLLPGESEKRQSESEHAEMTECYLDIRFRVAAAMSEWPSEFVILSAYATTGQTWPEERNAAADRRLEAELRARQGWTLRVVGYSPSTGHAEPSWATSMSFEEAIEVGRQFEQDAIFHVRGDILSVAYCDDRRGLVPVGSFQSRVDRGDNRPDIVSES